MTKKSRTRMSVQGQRSYTYPVNLQQTAGAMPKNQAKRKTVGNFPQTGEIRDVDRSSTNVIHRNSVMSMPPRTDLPPPPAVRRIYKIYYNICMTCMFFCFILALTCCFLAATAFYADKSWNRGVRNGNFTMFSTPEARRSLVDIYGLDWKVNLQRKSQGLLFFFVFTAISAVGYLFHVWIYHVDLKYYRTTVTIYIHVAGVVVDIIAIFLMIISMHSQEHDTKDIDSAITEYYGNLVFPTGSVLLVRPGYSYFYYCPLLGDSGADTKTQSIINNANLCQDSLSKILALLFLIINILLYLTIIFVSFKWKAKLKQVDPISDDDNTPEETTEVPDDTDTSVVQRAHKHKRKQPEAAATSVKEALAAENANDNGALPKLGYLTLGFDPSTSHIPPPEQEPIRPTILHVTRSSAARLDTLADKTKHPTV